MTGLSPGSPGEGSSSSTARLQHAKPSAEDFDGDDRGDLSVDNALLDDDPLDEGSVNTSYGHFTIQENEEHS